MSTALVLRHASWNYPVDELSPKGIEEAQKLGRTLLRADEVIVSQYRRAVQTATALGYRNVIVDPRANELEYPESFPTPTEYAQFVFEKHLEDVQERAQAFLEMLRGTNGSRLLVISHRVLLIAVYALTAKGKIADTDWNIVDFANLEGFRIAAVHSSMSFDGLVRRS